MTRFKCDICSLTFGTEKSWNEHLSGKKHQLQIVKVKQMEELARRSIYLNNLKENMDPEGLKREMGQYGEIDRILPDKSGKNRFIVVEFKEEDAAQNLLHSIQRLKIGKSIIRIQPRQADYGDANASTSQLLHITEHQNQINAAKVIESIENVKPVELSAQIDSLISQFAITAEIAEERTKFVQHLQQYLQKFFICQIHIRIFGSSNTGLGFINSDLDLNMVFEDDLKDTDSGSSIGSPANSHADNLSTMDLDVQLTPEHMTDNPLDKATFNNLSKTDRIRLLNRMINAFRKEHSLVTAHVPIPNARTPVVRFLLRNPKGLPCELSVQNLFGECKANLVRDLVRAETTGKLWRLLFLLKLWATANGFFFRDIPNKKFVKKTEEPKPSSSNSQKGDIDGQEYEDTSQIESSMRNQHPSGHWNSYILSMCTIAFLQSQHKIPPIEQLIRPNSRTIHGWAMEYDLPFFQLDESIAALLKALFVFMYQQLKEDRVITLREGRIFKVKEFKEKYVDSGDQRNGKFWRFSEVNIQDPLELSHNIAANVSRESLAKLRWKVMFAISAIKRSPNDLRQLFKLENVRKLHEERWAEKEENKKKKGQNQGNENRSEEPMGNENDSEAAEGMEVDS